MFNLEENKAAVDALVAYMNDNREAKGVLMASLLKTQELTGYIPEEVIELIGDVLGVPTSRIDNVVHYYSFFKLQPGDYVEAPAAVSSEQEKKYKRRDIQEAPDKVVGNLDTAKTLDEYVAKGGLQGLAKALGHFDGSEIQVIKDSGYKGRGDGGFVAGLKWELTANVADPLNKGIICNADGPSNVLDYKIIHENPFKLIEALVIAGHAVGAHQGFIYTSDVRPMEQAIADAYQGGILGKNILGTEEYFDLEVRFSDDTFISPREVEVNEFIERDLNIHRERKVNDRSFGVYGRPREYYITEKCIGCTKCAKHCPVSCIESAPKTRHIIDPKACIRCGMCMSVCPVAAIVYTNLGANVETLINIPDIIAGGPEAFKAVGAEKNPGRKIISLEGDVNAPGLIEVPTDMTLAEIIESYGKGTVGDFVGARVGGPIGTILGADKLEKPVDFETPSKFGLISGVMEGVSLYVIAGKTRIMDVALESARYAVQESCGKCTPCREGTMRMKEILERRDGGEQAENCFDQLAALSDVMESSSLCSLGQLAPTTMKSILAGYKELL